MSDDLSSFLLARIAEDEKVARLAPDRIAERLEQQGDEIARRYGDSEPPEGAVSVADALWWTTKDAVSWIRRHNPARVLAECEAKRRIVTEVHHRAADGPRAKYVSSWEKDACEGCGSDCPSEDYRVEHVNQCPTLQLLALPYSDHPDYRDEWRP